MTGLRKSLAFAVLAVLMGAGRDLSAGGPGTPIGPASRIWITGASNIRRFTCRARQLDGTLGLRGLATRGPVLTGENLAEEPSVRVTVERLECGLGAMNRHLRETLHGAEHRDITFRLTSYEVDLTSAAPAARIVGQVTVAGVARPVAVTAALVADSLGRLHVQGSHGVRMTDFGVAPPRRFGGLLRVRDQITVHFDVMPGPDGSAVDGIRCIVAPSDDESTNPGALHVSHD